MNKKDFCAAVAQQMAFHAFKDGMHATRKSIDREARRLAKLAKELYPNETWVERCGHWYNGELEDRKCDRCGEPLSVENKR